MKKLLIYALFLILLVAFVFANDFTVKTSSVRDVITLDDIASFDLTIKNLGISDSFSIYYNGVEWDIPAISFYNYQF